MNPCQETSVCQCASTARAEPREKKTEKSHMIGPPEKRKSKPEIEITPHRLQPNWPRPTRAPESEATTPLSKGRKRVHHQQIPISNLTSSREPLLLHELASQNAIANPAHPLPRHTRPQHDRQTPIPLTRAPWWRFSGRGRCGGPLPRTISRPRCAWGAMTGKPYASSTGHG